MVAEMEKAEGRVVVRWCRLGFFNGFETNEVERHKFHWRQWISGGGWLWLVALMVSKLLTVVTGKGWWWCR